MHTKRSTPPSTVRMSRIRAEDVVRYARWFKELIKGNVEVQSSALRSYKVVVICTEALLTLGMLKLTSRILTHSGAKKRTRSGAEEKWMATTCPPISCRNLLHVKFQSRRLGARGASTRWGVIVLCKQCPSPTQEKQPATKPENFRPCCPDTG